MKDWFYSNNFKTQQRHLNKIVRDANKNIADDNLWRGRFFARQIEASMYHFSDGSGGELFVRLRFYDKHTLKYVDVFDTASAISYKIYLFFNRAVTEVFDVWRVDKDDPFHPYNDTTDYNMIDNQAVVEHSVEWSPVHNWMDPSY